MKKGKEGRGKREGDKKLLLGKGGEGMRHMVFGLIFIPVSETYNSRLREASAKID